MSTWFIAIGFLVPLGIAAAQPDAALPSSVQLHSGQTATVRIKAPNAHEVLLKGDWSGKSEQVPMKREENGTWSVIIGPLEPGLYSYAFVIDKVQFADPHNPISKPDLGAALTGAPLSPLLVPGPEPQFWQDRPVAHGTVHIERWPSSDAVHDSEVFVYTPPGYEVNSAVRYPVLYLLHGAAESGSIWIEWGRANFILDNLIADKKCPPMVVAMPFSPPGNPVAMLNFFAWAQTTTSRLQQELFQNIIPHVEREYRVSAHREDRAIAGLSLGGTQSLLIGLAHLDTFAYIGSFSAGFLPSMTDGNYSTLLRDPNAINDKLKLLWIACGKQDGLWQSNQLFLAALGEKGVRHKFAAGEEAHVWTAWRRNLRDFAELLFGPSLAKGEKAK